MVLSPINDLSGDTNNKENWLLLCSLLSIVCCLSFGNPMDTSQSHSDMGIRLLTSFWCFGIKHYFSTYFYYL